MSTEADEYGPGGMFADGPQTEDDRPDEETPEQQVIDHLGIAATHISSAMSVCRSHGTFGELKKIHDETLDLQGQMIGVEEQKRNE